MSIHILGIRHHGPGSAKHVLKALHELKPDIVLIEGPPEGEALLSWAKNADMKPPVSLLAYVPDNPQKAVFYPFTAYSPEWNAIQYGLSNSIPVRFIDMPLVHKLAENDEKSLKTEASTPIDAIEQQEEERIPTNPTNIARNPIAYLAEIAGFEDAEEWWEHQFELSNHNIVVFDAIAESMAALREVFPKEDLEEKRREAFMRKAIKQAQKEMYSVIAVICGAWHVPALQNMPTQKQDDEILKNLPKTKVDLTWIPWTNDRLAFESGYGAGVDSPGWYQHIWHNPTDDGTKWLAYSAQVFRKNNIDISSAHIIEAVRLVQALAGLRGLSTPSLKELNEATQTVMCMGDDIPMQIIRNELVIGNQMGQVPEGTPQVPLQKNFEDLIKKLRLKLSNEAINITLDLREATDLQKSIFLNRLQVLNINWGRLSSTKSKGTFKEEWQLLWTPELILSLIDKAIWGNTVELAANQYLQHQADSNNDLPFITKLIQIALPAELNTGIKAVMHKMNYLAASTTDTSVLMDALNPLVQVSRYGNVRKTDLDTIFIILEAIFYRITASLPISCTNINDDQATIIAQKIEQVHASILLLDDSEIKNAWMSCVLQIIQNEHAAALIHGLSCKLLYDLKELNSDETAIAFSKALSTNNNPNYSANWMEGFLKSAANVLIFDDNIWTIVNNWVATLSEENFIQVIPLLRRTFSSYNKIEKQKIATKVNHNKTSIVSTSTNNNLFNHPRANKIIPVLEKIMGLN